MIVIGLTGGMGSGKSTALRVFKRLGAHVIDADKLARQAVMPGRPAWLAIKERFGPKVFYKNNRLNRKKMARIAFDDKKALKDLTAIIHPEVLRRERELVAEIAEKDKNAVIVIDAPMMIESGSHKWKNALVVMDTSRENQIKRLLKTGRFTRTQIEKRIAAQMPLSKKLRLADYVIDNNGTPAQRRKKAEEVFRAIVSKHLR